MEFNLLYHMTDDPSELSPSEMQLIGDYLDHTNNTLLTTVANLLTSPEFGGNRPFGTGISDIVPIISDSVGTQYREILRLRNMKQDLISNSESLQKKSERSISSELTHDDLYLMSLRSDLISYHTQVGTLIEDLTVQLVFEDVVDDDRQSKRIRNDIENKPQSEREWLLFATGIVDSGEKDMIRTAYRQRNRIVHDSDKNDIFENYDLQSQISESWEAVNLLHKKLHGIELNSRIGEILTDVTGD
jgi:hypothetical protein